MAKSAVTLSLEDIGRDAQPGVTFSLQLRDVHMPHAVADALIDTSEIHSAQTDAAGTASIAVNETRDYVLGSGAYIVKVGMFLTREVEIPVGGGSLRAIILAGPAPPNVSPRGQLGYIPSPAAPASPVPYLSWYNTDTQAFRLWDATTSTWVPWPGGSGGDEDQVARDAAAAAQGTADAAVTAAAAAESTASTAQTTADAAQSTADTAVIAAAAAQAVADAAQTEADAATAGLADKLVRSDLVAGTNVTLTAGTGNTVTIDAAGGGGGGDDQTARDAAAAAQSTANSAQTAADAAQADADAAQGTADTAATAAAAAQTDADGAQSTADTAVSGLADKLVRSDIVAGANITLTAGTGNTVTVAAAAGGGGGSTYGDVVTWARSGNAVINRNIVYRTNVQVDTGQLFLHIRFGVTSSAGPDIASYTRVRVDELPVTTAADGSSMSELDTTLSMFLQATSDRYNVISGRIGMYADGSTMRLAVGHLETGSSDWPMDNLNQFRCFHEG